MPPTEPSPVTIVNRGGTSPFLLLADHAGDAVPRALGRLGLAAADFGRHIAVDIGIAGLARALSALLDATLVAQHYSRLVVDCNRDPARADAIPAESDGTRIPGNSGLDAAERDRRVAAIHTPYHAAIARILASRDEAGQPTILVALHSFTPVMAGRSRPWHVGVLHDGAEDGFARALLALLSARPGIVVGDNEPYTMDGTDYTVPRHAFASRRLYAELEVRQDLIADRDGQARWARLLADALGEAAVALGQAAPSPRA